MTPESSSPWHNNLRFIGKILLLLFICLHALNLDYQPVAGRLDPSWQYIINTAAAERTEFIFTSGPFGFINYPMPVDHNLEIAIIVRVLFWLGLCGSIFYVGIKNIIPLKNLLVFAGLFALSSSLSFDYLVCLISLGLLFGAFRVQHWQPYYVVVIVFSGLLGLIKLSAAMLNMACCVMFVGVTLFQQRRKTLQAGAMTAAGIPLVFCSAYLLYDPSWSRMIAYLQRAFDISAGYNIAMSVPGRVAALWLALAIALAYTVFMICLWLRRDSTFWLTLIALPALFFAFKHGFVRQDGHEIILFQTAALLVGLLLLVSRFEYWPKWQVVLIVPILLPLLFVSGYTTSLSEFLGNGHITKLFALLNYSHTKATLQAKSQELLRPYHLPTDWLNAINTQPISIFPWEAGYAPANHLNYRPFPVIQTYSTYTPRLDQVNADFLAQPATAPTFVLMEWKALDDRHALLDVPAMWHSLYNWYEGTSYHDPLSEMLLLQRRATPRFQTIEPLRQLECDVRDFIEIPASDHPVLMQVKMPLNLKGLLAKVFFRVPEVDIEILSNAGYRIYRIVPDTLENPMLINFLPISLEDVQQVLTSNQTATRMYGVKFSGDGLPLYQSKIQVAFYHIPELQLADVPLPNLSELSRLSATTDYQLDKVYVYAAKQWGVGTQPAPAFLIIKGWAVDTQAHTPAGGVYLDFNGALYPTYYGFPSPELAQRVQQPAYAFCGFQAGIPLAALGKGQNVLSLKILTPDRTAYYAVDQVVSFELK